MNAKLTKTGYQGAKNLSGEKEVVQVMILVAHKDGKFSQPVAVRWYMSRSGDGASPLYCSIWVNRSPYYVSGHGVAKGCGYDKPSAAFRDACDSAGIELSEDVDGRGNGLVREALYAIGAALGFDRTELFICEG